jgi:hypothetical protein
VALQQERCVEARNATAPINVVAPTNVATSLSVSNVIIPTKIVTFLPQQYKNQQNCIY